MAGTSVGCTDLMQVFDQKYVAQIHRGPGGQVPGLRRPRVPGPVSTAGFPALGSPREPTDEVGGLTGEPTIPSMTFSQAGSIAIRGALCPSVVSGRCVGGQRVTGALVDPARGVGRPAGAAPHRPGRPH